MKTLFWTRWRWLVALLLLLTTGFCAHRYWQKENRCYGQGRIDLLQSVLADGQFHTVVEGWVMPGWFKRDYQLLVNGALITITPDIARPDVASTFANCPRTALAGFRIKLAQLQNRSVQLIANKRQLDEKTLATDHRGDIDNNTAFELNGRNIISGWAMSDVPLTLKVYAGEQLQVTVPVNRTRTDVASVFKGHPHASLSGFEVILPVPSLPRGRYPLRLLFEEPKGRGKFEKTGPLIDNTAVLAEYDGEHHLTGAQAAPMAVWAAHESGVRSVVWQREGGQLLQNLPLSATAVPYQIPQTDITPNRYLPPPILASGSRFTGSLPKLSLHAPERSVFKLTANDGTQTTLPGPLLLPTSPATKACKSEPKQLYWAIDGSEYTQRYVSQTKALLSLPCLTIGLRTRTEYLRHTLGAKQDFLFDPDFKARSSLAGEKGKVYVSLNESLQLAQRLNAPLMLTLDGGVWADAVFPLPEFDVVDHLETDINTVQWNQKNEAMADDALKGLSGSYAEPQLSRMMSLSAHNTRFMNYKKRNFQAAIKHIAAFQQAHPKLAIRVALDPDNTINPWFKDQQWYDYNPHALKQFREWLTHSGLYASGQTLSGRGIATAKTLAEINTLAKQNWADLSQVDPPRGPLLAGDAWYDTWVQFKRHLVGQHYADLTRWAVAAGLKAEQVVTSIGVNDAAVAITINEPALAWSDQAGISLEGGSTAYTGGATMGLLVYGPTARNERPTRNQQTLYKNVQQTSARWGIAEFNPSHLDLSHQVANNAEARAMIRSALQHGALFFSPIPGSKVSDQLLFPKHFKGYDAFDGTPFETELIKALFDWDRQQARR